MIRQWEDIPTDNGAVFDMYRPTGVEENYVVAVVYTEEYEEIERDIAIYLAEKGFIVVASYDIKSTVKFIKQNSVEYAIDDSNPHWLASLVETNGLEYFWQQILLESPASGLWSDKENLPKVFKKCYEFIQDHIDEHMQPPPKRGLALHLVGDSTVANKENILLEECGWGQAFRGISDIKLINHGFNGRSTKTFVELGHWDYVLKTLQAGDYCIIQFGHNDRSAHKPERYVAPDKFKINIKKMIDDVLNKKAVPILATPVCFRQWENGKFVSTHGEYSKIIRDIAKEKNLQLLELEYATNKMVEELGEEKSKAYFLEDNVHFSKLGAKAVAEIVKAILEVKSES